jgi:hypothetical protein
MQLDDGRFLMSPLRYQHLLKTTTEQKLELQGVHTVSANFRVCFIGQGEKLDPPLRSRLQGHTLDPVEIEMLMPSIAQMYDKRTSDAVGAIQSALRGAHDNADVEQRLDVTCVGDLPASLPFMLGDALAERELDSNSVALAACLIGGSDGPKLMQSVLLPSKSKATSGPSTDWLLEELLRRRISVALVGEKVSVVFPWRFEALNVTFRVVVDEPRF